MWLLIRFSSVLLPVLSLAFPVNCFQFAPELFRAAGHRTLAPLGFLADSASGRTSRLSSSGWNGEVVSNAEDGRIRGCKIVSVGETEFNVEIDGNEADLGKFGAVIYRKIISDAKSQRFQGFRPGTIPPHLLLTYRAFAMDEVAREAVLEAMQQNNIRPFESARESILITQISIPPKKTKNRKKKKQSKEKPGNVEPLPWRVFDTMKEALKAGWEPGESFSFVAVNCKGQKINVDSDQ